jgi:hypothetical protein
MKHVSNYSDRNTGVGNMGKTDGSAESLIFFRVIIAQLDLEVATLFEFTLLPLFKHFA